MKYSKYNQSNISNFFHNFDSAKSQINYDFLAISTDEYKNKVPCQINNFSYYRHKQGYPRQTDPYIAWQLPEEPNNCSRADIGRAYRLGDGF